MAGLVKSYCFKIQLVWICVIRAGSWIEFLLWSEDFLSISFLLLPHLADLFVSQLLIWNWYGDTSFYSSNLLASFPIRWIINLQELTYNQRRWTECKEWVGSGLIQMIVYNILCLLRNTKHWRDDLRENANRWPIQRWDGRYGCLNGERRRKEKHYSHKWSKADLGELNESRKRDG